MRVIFLRSNAILPDPRVEKEADSLIKFGYQVMALAWDRSENDHNKNGYISLENGQLSVRRFQIKAGYGRGLRNLVPHLLFQFKLFGWLVKHHKEFDCIHACDFDTAYTALIISKLYRKPLIYDIFDYYVDSFQIPNIIKPLLKNIDKRIMNAADAVIITNESRIEQISKSNPKKLVVIHNSPKFNQTLVNQPETSQREKYRFVYVGILSKSRLIEEVLKLFINTPDWELHIAGFGILENEVKSVATQNNNIHYYGRIPYKQTLELESTSDILFAVYHPTKMKNNKYASPNKLYEAMMLGKPIIVAKGTGIDEMVKKYGLGKVIDYSGTAFKRAAEELISENTFSAIRGYSQALYHQQFSWDIMEQRLGNLYDLISKSIEK